MSNLYTPISYNHFFSSTAWEAKTHMCEATVSGFGAVTGAVVGYFAKQTFIVYELNAVRIEITQCVTSIAQRYFGFLAAESVGYSAGVFLALPISNIIGDIIWTSISEGTRATTFLIGRSFGLYKDTSLWPTTQLKIAARIACAVVGHFSKCLVVCYSMPYVQQTLFKIATSITPLLCNGTWGKIFLTPISFLIATSYTPAVTIILGDITSFAVQSVLYAATLHYLEV